MTRMMQKILPKTVPGEVSRIGAYQKPDLYLYRVRPNKPVKICRKLEVFTPHLFELHPPLPQSPPAIYSPSLLHFFPTPPCHGKEKEEKDFPWCRKYLQSGHWSSKKRTFKSKKSLLGLLLKMGTVDGNLLKVLEIFPMPWGSHQCKGHRGLPQSVESSFWGKRSISQH